MRKLLLLIVSVAMILGGLYWLIAQLVLADIVYFKFVIAAAALITLGAYLLWTDFVAPMFGIKGGR